MLAVCAAAALAIGVAQAPSAASEEAASAVLQPHAENNPADKHFPAHCGHACQDKMAKAKAQKTGGNKIGHAIKGAANLYAPSSVGSEHPPHFHIDGKETRLFLKSGSEVPCPPHTAFPR